MFFFAWVDETDTEFVPAFERVDEEIFSFEIEHDEGQVPTLDITIINPRVGLLAPGRKVWAWFAYESPVLSGVIPLFFGVLVGVPSNLFAEKIALKFIARAPDYIRRKQAAAETLKVRPYYDPVFLDERHRDDPDAIIEGWSALYHVDRVSLAVTASDVLTGEDGLIEFHEGDAFYSSVGLQLGQPPLANVQVQATVNWTQRTWGTVDGPNVNIESYTGDSFANGWPKPGAEVGGGWRVAASYVNDVYKVAQTPMASWSSSWTNNASAAADGDTQEMTNQASFPALLSPDPLSYITSAHTQSGICDPDADPPVNRPAKVEVQGVIIPKWVLNCTWTLRYEAKREYSEFLVMDVTANTQSLLASPTVEQDTELLTIAGGNVGEPLLTFLARSDFAGLPVDLGQIIFPNNPTVPGGLSYQICVQPGIAALVEPVFSDVVGAITDDGTVKWASLGPQPLTSQPNWRAAAQVPLGLVICYEPVVFSEALGDLVSTGEAVYYICTRPGETNRQYAEIVYTPPVTTNVEFTPAPQQFFYIPGPPFVTTPGAIVNEAGDGTAQWTCLGQQPALLGIPIGGSAEHVTARCYFPTDRGRWSVEHLICRARARLRLRARAVKLSWECPFDLAIGLSCRMNAALHDPRLPGGIAVGKVTSYKLSGDGDGRFVGKVEIGCPVGLGGTVAAIAGDPEWVDDDYVDPDYQVHDGERVVLPADDIGYTPPVFAAFDDGLSFPLRELPGRGAISGSAEAQKAVIEAAIPITRYLDNLGTQFLSGSTQPTDGTSGTVSAITPDAAWWIEELRQINYAETLPYVMEANPVSWEYLLDPVAGGVFNGAYAVAVTPLEISQGIDLTAGSAP
jgi:hypothetical protein